jgi:hypothetical protein
VTASQAAPLASASAAPLAAAPGPLPGASLAPAPGPLPGAFGTTGTPRSLLSAQHPEPASSTGRSIALVLAGALVVLAGFAAGWTVVRTAGGQSPLTTLNVTRASVAAPDHKDAKYRFVVPVPNGWIQYRDEPIGAPPTITYVSPDSSEALSISPAPDMPTAVRAAGSDDPPFTPVDGVPEARDLTWSTESRTSWRRVVPAGPDQALGKFWTITLTVPEAAAGSASHALFDRLADGFTPPS